jgi:Xaa-Pro aminopeptidase
MRTTDLYIILLCLLWAPDVDGQGISEFQQRRNSLRSHVKNNDFVVMIGVKGQSAKLNYQQPLNFHYLTGFPEPNALMILGPDGSIPVPATSDTVSEVLFVMPQSDKWTSIFGTVLGPEAAQEQFQFESALSIAQFDSVLHWVVTNATTVHIEYDATMVEDQLPRELDLVKWASDEQLLANIKNIIPAIENMRGIKSDAEVASIQGAVDITEAAVRAIMQQTRPGLNEQDVETLILDTFDSLNSEGVAFPSTVASGSNTCVFHYGDNNRQMESGDLLQIDIGARHNSYSADITRTFPVNGKFTERQRQIYELVLSAQLQGIEAMQPGAPVDIIQSTIIDVYQQGLLALGIIQDKSEYIKYYPHQPIHHLGLYVHDAGALDILRPGMVFAVEPGLYFPDENMGIRLEDDVLVTENGPVILSTDIPRTVEDIEALMTQTLTSIPETPAIPTEFKLQQNYPNPFNPATTIRYALSHDGYVKLTVFNLLGQRVQVLVNEHRHAGNHVATWEGTDHNGQPVGSGVYLYEIVAGEHRQTIKMLLLR